MNMMTTVALRRLLVEFLEGRHSILADPSVAAIRTQALSAATLASQAGAERNLIIATLLRDIAPLIATGRSPRRFPAFGSWYGQTIILGGEFADLFDDTVLQPILLQPEAERYLLTMDADYRGGLSAAEIRSLSICDRPLCDDDLVGFEQRPFSRAALDVCRWHAAASSGSEIDPSAYIRLLTDYTK